jgi:mRNA interferase RelE/StbE
MYSIYIKKSAKKELELLPKKEKERISKRINNLSQDPRPDGCTKLKGENYYRVRQGNYRIVYSIMDNKLIVEIIKIQHRKKVYL